MSTRKDSRTMGSEANPPIHQVTISRPFYLGRCAVTQAQWVAIMEENPSVFQGENHPVEKVSWEDVQEFIRRLNAREGGSSIACQLRRSGRRLLAPARRHL